MNLFYIGLGGFPTSLIGLMILDLMGLDFKALVPMIIWTAFCGFCIIFGKR